MAGLRRRRVALAVLCVAAVALGGLLGAGIALYALPLPQWTFLPDGTVRPVSPPQELDRERPLALFTLAPPRGPPLG